MAAEIENITNVVETKKNIKFSQVGLSRKLAIGSDWNKIRIGIMLSTNISSNLTPSPFYFGLCSGTENMVGFETVDHFIGIKNKNLTVQTYFPSDVSNHIVIVPFNYSKITNGSETLLSATDNGGLGSNSPCFGVTTGRQYPFIIEITKGSPNYTLDFYASSANGTYQSWSKSTIKFQSDFSLNTLDTNPTNGFFKQTTQSTPVDELTYGYLDTICFSNTNAFSLYIPQVLVKKLS